MTTVLALIQLGRELRMRPAKAADRACRIGEMYIAADQRADLYEALLTMALLDEDEATGELACHLHDEACRLEDAGAYARLAWAAWLEAQPAEAA